MDIPVLISNSGVYAIICLITGKRYIGSSKNLLVRLKRHRRLLRKGEHTSPHLQNAWSKYGEDAFEMSIVEYCPLECLLDREQFYLDDFQPYEPTKGFNTQKRASNAGNTYVSTSTAVDKIKAYLATNRDQHIAKRIAIQGKPFRLKSPTGEIHEGVGIQAFARQQGLKAGDVKALVAGKAKSIKGWALPETTLPPQVLEDPDGHQHVVPHMGLVPFCRARGLCANSIRKVRDGRAMAYKGWRLPSSKDTPVVLIDPQGQEVSTSLTRLGLFAAEHGLRTCNLAALVRGTNTQYHGWTVKQPCHKTTS